MADLELTEAERAVLMEFSQYAPLEPYPGKRTDRWLARCLLCGATCTVKLATLDDVQRQRGHAKRYRCAHPAEMRPPKPLVAITAREAAALLRLIDSPGTVPTRHAVTGMGKLRRLAADRRGSHGN